MPHTDLGTTCSSADDRSPPHIGPSQLLSVKGRLILLLLSSEHNSPVTRSLTEHTFSCCFACVSIRRKADRRQTVGSHGALFIAFHWNLWPVLACLMKPAPHNEGHWSFFSFHIHLDISVTAHRASPLNPGEILSLYLVTRYFIGCTDGAQKCQGWGLLWCSRRWVWTFEHQWARSLRVVPVPNLRPW